MERSSTRMSCRRGRLEVGRRLPLDNYYLHHRLLTPGSREVLKEIFAASPPSCSHIWAGNVLANPIPKSTAFRVGY